MNRWHIHLAVRTLRGGGIIAYPTEGVWGLGCDPYQADAVLRLLQLKRRPVDKGLILIAADFEQLRPFVEELEPARLRQIRASWPGPVTWLLPSRAQTPWWLRGAHDTIAVRVTAHPLAAALCSAAGSALVSTSANISQRAPAKSALRIQSIFGERVDYALHGAIGGRGKPSEIRDARTGAVIRPG